MSTLPSAPWWRSAVIYQIYIRSFADQSGDGVGDIAGIRSRLPYLRSLGIDAIWITPWYRSPMVDAGYDVADYTEIDPLFGGLPDAEALIKEAHNHDVRVILDIVPNHTSDRHPWFQAALAVGPGEPARDRYYFRAGRGPGGDLPPNDWHSAFGGSAWTRVPDGEWFLHLFAAEQPDLNWENPHVRRGFEDILVFWFDRGVDGFRIDVAHALIKQHGLPDLGHEGEDVLEAAKRDDHPHWDRDGVHEIFRDWRRVADRYPGDRTFVAEVWVSGRMERLARYVRSDELHTAFNFDFLRTPWDAARIRTVIDVNLDALGSVGAPATWVLSNHDVVRHLTRYGRAHTEWRGMRKNVPEPADLTLGNRRARAAALLMFALPGGAYVYQGEELGLPEVEDIPAERLKDPVWERSGHRIRGRDGCRVPLPWSGDAPPYGFGIDGVRPWLPQPRSWRSLSAEAQAGDPGSMLQLYRSALRLRRDLPALGEGALRWNTTPGGVLSFHRPPGFVCTVNLSNTPYELPAHSEILLASGPLDGASLPPDTTAWLAVTEPWSYPDGDSR